MLENFLAYQGPPCPAYPAVAIALRQGEHAGLSAKDTQVDKRLLRWRGMRAEDRVVFPAATVEQLARGDGVGCLAGREQGRANNEHLAVMLWRRRVWLVLRERCRREEK